MGCNLFATKTTSYHYYSILKCSILLAPWLLIQCSHCQACRTTLAADSRILKATYASLKSGFYLSTFIKELCSCLDQLFFVNTVFGPMQSRYRNWSRGKSHMTCCQVFDMAPRMLCRVDTVIGRARHHIWDFTYYSNELFDTAHRKFART